MIKKEFPNAKEANPNALSVPKDGQLKSIVDTKPLTTNHSQQDKEVSTAAVSDDFGDDAPQAMNGALQQYMEELKKLNPNESNMFRIEKTRVFLEKEIGFDRFFNVWQVLTKANEDENATGVNQEDLIKMLGDQAGYLNLIVQLIYMESKSM